MFLCEKVKVKTKEEGRHKTETVISTVFLYTTVEIILGCLLKSQDQDLMISVAVQTKKFV